MAKRKQLKVSQHESGQFVKWVGKTRGGDGKLRPKCWYLGDNETAAMLKAASLRDEWKALKSQGIDVWPQRTIEPEPQSVPTPILVTLEQAAKEYIDGFNAEAKAQQITREHAKGMHYCIEKVIAYLGPKATLSSIGEKQVKQFVLTIAGRPDVSTWNGKPHQMALSYARRIIREGRIFLEWTHRKGYWPNRPPFLDHLFKFRLNRSTTEREAMLSVGNTEPKFLTVPELTRLFEASCERHRLWILLALNCGFTQAELNSLRRFEIKDLDGPSPRIERFRQKTDVYARWALWPETASLLGKYMAPPNEEEFALTTERGGRLKSVCDSGAFSGIAVAWVRIMKRSGVPVTFKFLRKTGAWMTKRIGGLEVSEMYLSHSEPGMNKHYAGREWDKLDVALHEMRRQIQPMFEVKLNEGTFHLRRRRRRSPSAGNEK